MELPQVVNYELPHVPEDYVHRIGRTGRAGCAGRALSLVSSDEHDRLRAIERVLGRRIDVLPLDRSSIQPTPSSQSDSSGHGRRPASHSQTPAPDHQAPALRNARPAAAGPRAVGDHRRKPRSYRAGRGRR